MSEGSSRRQGAEEDVLVNAVLGNWRDQLVNLTGSNRLINFKPRATSAITVNAPEPPEVIEKLWRGKPLRLRAGDDDSDDETTHQRARSATEVDVQGSTQDVRRASRNLLRRSQQEFLDRGLRVLYLAIGRLTWHDETNAEFNSPLLLVPVELVDQGRDALPALKQSEDDPLVNPALALRIVDLGVEMPRFDVDEFDINGYLEDVTSAVRRKATWAVENHCVLSYFTFAKEAMYRDLSENADRIISHSGIRALAGYAGDKTGEDFAFESIPDGEIDTRASPAKLPLVLDADSSQRACVAAAVEGRSFVMDGPPGTGKSQTIANMIGALLHAGKTVLFVSEKAAALDVVRNRLTDVGLSAFVFDLHSNKATRKEVATALGEAVDQEPRAPVGLLNVERDELERHQASLNDYARAMNIERKPLGRSLHSVLGQIAEMYDVPTAPATGQMQFDLTAEDVADVRHHARAISSAWRPALEGRAFVWWGVQERRSLESRLAGAEAALRSLAALVDMQEEVVSAFNVTRPSQASVLASLAEATSTRPDDVPEEFLTRHSLDDAVSAARDLDQSITILEEARQVVSTTSGAQWSNVPTLSQVPSIMSEVPANLTPGALAFTPWTSTDCALVVDECANQLALVMDIEERGREVAHRLGVSLPVSVIDLQRLVKLASVAMESDRPFGPWLIHGTDFAREASAALEAAARELREAAGAALAVFKPDVLEHDVEALENRFATLHRGWRKLTASYRSDRAVVTSLLREGIDPKSAVSQLVLATRWVEARRRLDSTEQQYASSLGPYYLRDRTDYQRLERAMTLAEYTIELVHGEGQGRLDPRRPHRDQPGSLAFGSLAALARAIGIETPPSLELSEATTELNRALAEWLVLTQAYNDVRRDLPTRDIASVRSWLQAHSDVLTPLVHDLESVEQAVGRSLSVGEARHLVELRGLADVAAEQLTARADQDSQLLGPLYRGELTDCQEVARVLSWAAEVRTFASPSGSSLSVAQVAALRGPLPAMQLRQAVEDWKSSRDAVLRAFSAERRVTLDADMDSYDEAGETLEDFLDDLGGQEEWFTYDSARRHLDARGLQGALGFCATHRVDKNSIPRVIEKAMLREWVDEQLINDPALSPARAVDRDALVAEFRRLDIKAVSSAVSDIILSCASRRPRSANNRAVGIVRWEAEKKKKHMPIRDLLARTVDVVQKVTPCFMMSPLSVSQFLPPDIEFDVVIFDEASQIAPADAINCIYRGRSLITAGDQKQLPPTNFFGGGSDTDGEWDEDGDDIAEFDSVLDLAKAAGAFNSLTLRWHYRSRHESLIAFSNQRFYDSKLITFPGAEQDGPDVGVSYFHVAGTYRRGSARDNPAEAAAVVDRVIHHFASRPGMSIGVVTFSEAQATAIQDLLERRSSELPGSLDLHSADRLDGFFVKSLESVQGDERDVMLFSIGYGPDENNKTTMNFGPLNRQGGWRRLNVAITRARYRNEIIASIGASDIGDSVSNEAVRHLRGYLDFAERGPAALALDVGRGGDAESPFEESVLQQIRAWGYDVTPQVGVASYRIDIGVRHPDRPGAFVLGVECDGYQYHSSQTARDRDRLREQVLSGLGWRLHRIWGISWYRQRNDEAERLRAAIEEACTQPLRGLLSVGGEPESTERKVVELSAAVFHEPAPWAAVYEVAQPERLPHFVDLTNSGGHRLVRAQVEEIVRVESPIHLSQLTDRMRDVAGLLRASSKVRRQIDIAVAAADVVRDGDFVRAPSARLQVRRPGSLQPRKVEHVHDDELSLAVVNVILSAGPMDRDILTTEGARIFGWTRRGSDIATRLERVVSRLIAEEILEATAYGALRATVDERWVPPAAIEKG